MKAKRFLLDALPDQVVDNVEADQHGDEGNDPGKLRIHDNLKLGSYEQVIDQ